MTHVGVQIPGQVSRHIDLDEVNWPGGSAEGSEKADGVDSAAPGMLPVTG